MKRFLLFSILFCVPFLTFGSNKPRLILSTNIPLQGDVVEVILENSGIKSASFKDSSVSFFPYGGNLVALIPISGTEPAQKQTLYITLSDGSLATRSIWIRARKFSSISLGIPKGSDLTTDRLISDLSKEKVVIDEIVGKKTNVVYFEDFQFPLSKIEGVSSPFGEIRKTGNSIIRHWGVDYVAPRGSSVYAISGGVVAKSYWDSTYGNTVIIDHGQNVFSLYMHLDERLKQNGESVQKGEKIGILGSTGYSFGPHLHLSIKINGMSVDPTKFINLLRR